MMDTPCSKQDVQRILQMHRSGLVSWKHLSPWAAAQIEQLDEPPAWLCELVSLQYRGHIDKCLEAFVLAPPFEPLNLNELSDYLISCLFARFEQREISWATFLQEAGQHADGTQAASEDCEWFYDLLNELEDTEFDDTVTARQVEKVRQLLSASIEQVTEELAPFAEAFRKDAAIRLADRANDADGRA